MRELERIASALRRASLDGSRALLATVVGTAGSTYRKLGARMAVTPEQVVGAISGGCLEADILERWNGSLGSGRPELVTYDSRSPGDRLWGFGLGCSGRVDVLLEPLAGAALTRVQDCFGRVLDTEIGALATIVATDSPSTLALGDRFLVGGDGGLVASWSSAAELGSETSAMLRDGWSVIATGRPRRRQRSVSGAKIEVLWEALRRAPRLAICGAGGDAMPLSTWATAMGWKVQVIDHRPAFARIERFPSAAEVVVVAPGSTAAILRDGSADAVVVMSHHFDRDFEYLASALASGAWYVGVLGPRARRDRLLAELAATPPGLAPDLLSRLYAPIGLDLGADTPEEIALAIVAELMAVQRGRSGGSLRARRVGIHESAPAASERIRSGSAQARGDDVSAKEGNP